MLRQRRLAGGRRWRLERRETSVHGEGINEKVIVVASQRSDPFKISMQHWEKDCCRRVRLTEGRSRTPVDKQRRDMRRPHQYICDAKKTMTVAAGRRWRRRNVRRLGDSEGINQGLRWWQVNRKHGDGLDSYSYLIKCVSDALNQTCDGSCLVLLNVSKHSFKINLQHEWYVHRYISVEWTRMH